MYMYKNLQQQHSHTIFGPQLFPIMELLPFSSIPLFFASLLFIFFVFIKARYSISKLPPGPWKLPVIGNLLHLIGALPHHRLRDLAKKYGPVMHLKLGEVSAIVISSAEAAKQVLKTNDIALASRPEIMAVKILSYDATNLIFAPYGPYWRQLRKICVVELLTAKRVQSFKSVREEEVENFIQSISSSPYAVNLSEKVSKLTNDIISRVAFGNKCKDQVEFISETTKAFQLASGFDLPDLFPSIKFLHSVSRVTLALKECHRKLDKILDDIISDHKEKALNGAKFGKEEDLVDVLLRVQESDDLEVPITINNIKAVILDIFGAGSETSGTVVEWAMSEMIRNPRVMETAQAEVRRVFQGQSKIEETDIEKLSYLNMVIKETLRLHPPVPLLLPREARERCEINGFEVPIKTKVIINAWALGRDPKYWIDAECFKPERFSGSSIDFKGTNYEFIPFGGGRRICPGMIFGTTNVEVPLANLLYHFDWKPADGIRPEELDMTETFGVVAKKKNQLYLTGTPYVS